MSNHTETSTNNDSLYYILALIFGAATAFVISGSILWSIFGAFVGLLFAAFFINALVKNRE